MGGSDVDGTGGTLGDRSTVWKEKFLNDLVMIVTKLLCFITQYLKIFKNSIFAPKITYLIFG